MTFYPQTRARPDDSNGHLVVQQNVDDLTQYVNDRIGTPMSVTGSRATGAALLSLLAALSSMNIIVDNTVP